MPLLAGVAAVLAASAAAGLAPMPAAAQEGKTLRATLHADVRALDPIWSTQVITSMHGNMIFDRLFATDEKLEPQPQMVEKWTVSEDKKTYVFTLREGLKFHDGTPVTSRDVIQSMKRWGVRDAGAKILFGYTDALTPRDDRTFEWKLKEPFGLVIETLAKNSSALPAVMREKDAMTDPFQPVQEMVGSGPFVFQRAEWVPGSKTVYTKFKDYVPRAEPASGQAGGKVAKVDRVEFITLSDPQTQQAALVAGEIDFLEAPQVDFLPILEATPGITITAHPAAGAIGVIQLNHLHPPFDKVEARQAMLHILHMPDYLNTFVPDRKLQKLCYSYFGCGTPMETDAGSDVYKSAKKDPKAAEALFKAAGYNGEPITILHSTDHWMINPATLVLIQQMRRAGLKLDVQAMDWGAASARRAKKEPPAQGGWNIFITGTTVLGSSNPIANNWIGMGCEKANFGWPCNAAFEDVRRSWGMAQTLAERKAIAVDLSKRAYEQVPFIPFGQWVSPMAYRSDRLSGVLSNPSMPPMWNIEKK
ncbi:ABC transporter substrate-binding protein [Allostella humosa]|nr:ABC transporter substrate-binding protein [Stella humosa]